MKEDLKGETPEWRKAWIESNQTPAGGYTKSFLSSVGVPWPPPKGWKKALVENGEFDASPEIPRSQQTLY